MQDTALNRQFLELIEQNTQDEDLKKSLINSIENLYKTNPDSALDLVSMLIQLYQHGVYYDSTNKSNLDTLIKFPFIAKARVDGLFSALEKIAQTIAFADETKVLFKEALIKALPEAEPLADLLILLSEKKIPFENNQQNIYLLVIEHPEISETLAEGISYLYGQGIVYNQENSKLYDVITHGLIEGRNVQNLLQGMLQLKERGYSFEGSGKIYVDTLAQNDHIDDLIGMMLSLDEDQIPYDHASAGQILSLYALREAGCNYKDNQAVYKSVQTQIPNIYLHAVAECFHAMKQAACHYNDANQAIYQWLIDNYQSVKELTMSFKLLDALPRQQADQYTDLYHALIDNSKYAQPLARLFRQLTQAGCLYTKDNQALYYKAIETKAFSSATADHIAMLNKQAIKYGPMTEGIYQLLINHPKKAQKLIDCLLSLKKAGFQVDDPVNQTMLAAIIHLVLEDAPTSFYYLNKAIEDLTVLGCDYNENNSALYFSLIKNSQNAYSLYQNLQQLKAKGFTYRNHHEALFKKMIEEAVLIPPSVETGRQGLHMFFQSGQASGEKKQEEASKTIVVMTEVQWNTLGDYRAAEKIIQYLRQKYPEYKIQWAIMTRDDSYLPDDVEQVADSFIRVNQWINLKNSKSLLLQEAALVLQFPTFHFLSPEAKRMIETTTPETTQIIQCQEYNFNANYEDDRPQSGLGETALGVFVSNNPLNSQMDCLSAIKESEISRIIFEADQSEADYLESHLCFFGYFNNDSSQTKQNPDINYLSYCETIAAYTNKNAESKKNIDLICRRQTNIPFHPEGIFAQNVDEIILINKEGKKEIIKNPEASGEGRVMRIIDCFPLPAELFQSLSTLAYYSAKDANMKALIACTGDQSVSEILSLPGAVPFYQIMDWKQTFFIALQEVAKDFPAISHYLSALGTQAQNPKSFVQSMTECLEDENLVHEFEQLGQYIRENENLYENLPQFIMEKIAEFHPYLQEDAQHELSSVSSFK